MDILLSIAGWIVSGLISLGLVAPSVPATPLPTPMPDPTPAAVVVPTVDPSFTPVASAADLQLGALPQQDALIDTYLAANISRTDTTMTLANGETRDGETLSGYYCFTVDINSPTLEYVCGTAAGTSVTGLMRGVKMSNPNATSSTLAQSHRRFASVQVTDFPFNQLAQRVLNGVDPFPGELVYYSSSSTADIMASSTSVLVTKGYVDDAAFSAAGAVDATTLAKGLVELATQLEAASSTAVGGSGNLGIPASAATSTYNSATAALRVVMTQNDGTIDGDFLGGVAPPVGSLTAYASTTAPTGWLLANGQAVSRTTYADLFEILGTSYGSGDGSSTFNLPDVTGKSIVMASSTQTTASGLSRDTLGDIGTTTTHTQTIAEMPSHDHDITVESNVGTGNNGIQYGNLDEAPNETDTTAVQATGSGTAFNILDPYIILNYIIKY